MLTAEIPSATNEPRVLVQSGNVSVWYGGDEFTELDSLEGLTFERVIPDKAFAAMANKHPTLHPSG